VLLSTLAHGPPTASYLSRRRAGADAVRLNAAGRLQLSLEHEAFLETGWAATAAVQDPLQKRLRDRLPASALFRAAPVLRFVPSSESDGALGGRLCLPLARVRLGGVFGPGRGYPKGATRIDVEDAAGTLHAFAVRPAEAAAAWARTLGRFARASRRRRLWRRLRRWGAGQSRALSRIGAQLRAFYAKTNPQKLRKAGFVHKILRVYAGQEGKMWRDIAARYPAHAREMRDVQRQRRFGARAERHAAYLAERRAEAEAEAVAQRKRRATHEAILRSLVDPRDQGGEAGAGNAADADAAGPTAGRGDASAPPHACGSVRSHACDLTRGSSPRPPALSAADKRAAADDDAADDTSGLFAEAEARDRRRASGPAAAAGDPNGPLAFVDDDGVEVRIGRPAAEAGEEDGGPLTCAAEERLESEAYADLVERLELAPEVRARLDGLAAEAGRRLAEEHEEAAARAAARGCAEGGCAEGGCAEGGCAEGGCAENPRADPPGTGPLSSSSDADGDQGNGAETLADLLLDELSCAADDVRRHEVWVERSIVYEGCPPALLARAHDAMERYVMERPCPAAALPASARRGVAASAPPHGSPAPGGGSPPHETVRLGRALLARCAADPRTAALDRALERRCALLQFLEPRHFMDAGAAQRCPNPMVLALAVRTLQGLNGSTLPSAKLRCVTGAFQQIASAMSFARRAQESRPGADDVFPVFVWTVLRARVRSLHANAEFVQTFRAPDAFKSMHGYCLASLQSAAAFLASLLAEEEGGAGRPGGGASRLTWREGAEDDAARERLRAAQARIAEEDRSARFHRELLAARRLERTQASRRAEIEARERRLAELEGRLDAKALSLEACVEARASAERFRRGVEHQAAEAAVAGLDEAMSFLGDVLGNETE
jgi:hypothetical protein